MRTIILLIALFTSPQLFAFTVGFNCITYNNSVDCNTGESQFYADITEADEDKILFTFQNNGSQESFIADIYFDSEYSLEVYSLIDADDGNGGDMNVDFSEGATPKNLPAAKSLDDPFVSSFGFQNDPGAANGIQINETLGILFLLTSDLSYEDLLTDLMNGSFKTGIHGQGFEDGGSESFTNTITTVPLPISFWLFGSGLLALLGLKSKH